MTRSSFSFVFCLLFVLYRLEVVTDPNESCCTMESDRSLTPPLIFVVVFRIKELIMAKSKGNSKKSGSKTTGNEERQTALLSRMMDLQVQGTKEVSFFRLSKDLDFMERTSSWRASWKELVEEGYVKPSSGDVSAPVAYKTDYTVTEKGIERFGSPEFKKHQKEMKTPATTEEEHQARIFKKLLNKKSVSIFELLLRHGSLSRKELAAIIGVSDRGHAFSYALQQLKTLQIVEDDKNGKGKKLRLSDAAFLDPKNRPETAAHNADELEKLMEENNKPKRKKLVEEVPKEKAVKTEGGKRKKKEKVAAADEELVEEEPKAKAVETEEGIKEKVAANDEDLVEEESKAQAVETQEDKEKDACDDGKLVEEEPKAKTAKTEGGMRKKKAKDAAKEKPDAKAVETEGAKRSRNDKDVAKEEPEKKTAKTEGAKRAKQSKNAAKEEPKETARMTNGGKRKQKEEDSCDGDSREEVKAKKPKLEDGDSKGYSNDADSRDEIKAKPKLDDGGDEGGSGDAAKGEEPKLGDGEDEGYTGDADSREEVNAKSPKLEEEEDEEDLDLEMMIRRFYPDVC